MTTTTHEAPAPETLGGRILAFYKRNRLEEYTRTELTQSFDVSASAVTRALEPLIEAGWLAERTDETHNRLVIAGPNLDDVELTPGSKLAQTIGAALTPKRKRRQPTLPRLDVNAITVKSGALASPRGGREKGESPYFKLLDKLTTPATWVELPSAYTYSLKNALTRYRKLHPNKVYRLVKVSDQIVHVQRLQDKSDHGAASQC